MKKIVILLTYMFILVIVANAQYDTMYVMKNGQVIGKHRMGTEVDSLTFSLQTQNQGPVSVSSISLTPNQATLSVGESRNLNDYLTVLPANATNKTVTWDSNNSSVASVNSTTGVVTALMAGSATITAWTADGSSLSSTIAITVVAGTANAYFSGTIPNAEYVGRWEKFTAPNGVVYDRSYYTGAMIKVNFTGTTAKLTFQTWASNAGLFVSIDGGEFVYISAESSSTGIINLTPTPLAPGEHSLKIVSGKAGIFTSQNNITSTTLVLDAGAETRPPSMSSKHIEFIGDSISTVTYGVANPYHWNFLIGHELGVEHTHIAHPGISMGAMATDYFKTYTSLSTNWNFSTYTPNVVVVNLGQNGGVSASNQATYTNFLLAIRNRFPNAYIIALGLFSSTSSSSNAFIQAAVTATGDAKIYYVPNAIGTTGGGDVHPTLAQSRTIADILKPIIAPYLGL